MHARLAAAKKSRCNFPACSMRTTSSLATAVNWRAAPRDQVMRELTIWS